MSRLRDAEREEVEAVAGLRALLSENVCDAIERVINAKVALATEERFEQERLAAGW